MISLSCHVDASCGWCGMTEKRDSLRESRARTNWRWTARAKAALGGSRAKLRPRPRSSPAPKQGRETRAGLSGEPATQQTQPPEFIPWRLDSRVAAEHVKACR